MDVGFPALARTVSTLIFASSMLPMLVQAARTRNIRSYSCVIIALSTSAMSSTLPYVFPITALHTFFLVATAPMLVWYHYERQARLRRIAHAAL